MRYESSLTSLADTITTHNTETIKRKIQLIAFSSMELSEKQLKLHTLRLAETFIKTHPALPENWRASLDCFKTLADYFIEQTSIEDYEEKAMCCWYLLLNQAIPQKIKTAGNTEITNDFSYEDIIILGKAYLSEPYQFAGFICWLLTRNVSPHLIRVSTLLHAYFNYHCVDLSIIEHTYALIKNFSEKVTAGFLHYLNTSPCLLRGLTNSKKEGEVTSYNLMGGTFTHTRYFPMLEDDSEENPPLEFLEMHVDILLRLFGLSFIKKVLAYPASESASILSKILNSPFKNTILNEFPMQALSGELDYDQSYAFLAQIGLTYYYFNRTAAIEQDAFLIYVDGTPIFPEEQALQAPLVELIKGNPFYIHVDGAFLLPSSIIHDAIIKLCENPNSKSVCHIPFLVSLSKRLKGKQLVDEHKLLINYLAEYLIELGNTLNDSFDDVIETIQDEFLIPFERKLAEYTDNIDDAVNQFLFGAGDYYEIERVAGEQLSTVNLINRLTPTLMETIQYPRGNYALTHWVLEKNFLFVTENETSFDSMNLLGNLLRQMSDNIKTRIRILQESFCLSKNIDYLREIIIYALKQDDAFISTFFHKPYGNECYVLDTIALHDDMEFREWALSVISPSDEEILACIKYSFEDDSLAKDYLFQSQHLSRKSAFEAIQVILTYHDTNDLKWKICEKYIFMMHQNAFSQELIRFAFLEAIKEPSINFINFLCNIEDDTLFPKDIIKESAIALMKANQWPLVNMLCGLSNETVNEKIIVKNNVGLLIEVLKEKTKYALIPSLYQNDIINQGFVLYNNENTLFHLAANSGCYQTVAETFYFFRKHISAKTICCFLHAKNFLGEIPRCDTDSEDAEKINDFLAQKRQQYKNCSVIDGKLWHNPEDRKRRRPEQYFIISDSSGSETDDEPEKNKGARIESFEDEYEQLLNM